MMIKKRHWLLMDVLQPFLGIPEFGFFKTGSDCHSSVVKVVRFICFSNLSSNLTSSRLIWTIFSDQCSFSLSQIGPSKQRDVS